MSGAQLRLQTDAAHLDRLAAASGGMLAVRAHASAAHRQVVIDLGLRTAADDTYPQRARSAVRLVVDLPRRYPFESPVARLDASTPVFHPNVFVTGVVCVGTRWQPSEGLDLFVTRVARLLAFDPLLVNLRSVANAAAAQWYARALRAHPTAFPSERIRWGETAAAADTEPVVPHRPAPDTAAPGNRSDAGAAGAGPVRTIRTCPQCGARLRLPVGRSGEVACPRCTTVFPAST